MNNLVSRNPILRFKEGKKIIKAPVFAGYRIGKTGGLNYSINDADKQLLIGTGQFTESDFTNALATQLALNRYFANSGLGSIKEDNAWGDQSRKALEFALSKSKSLTPFNNETTIVKTPVLPTYTPPTTPINLEVSNLKLNVNVPQQTYDRTGIREYLRSKGLNPYSFSGALRRALKMVMNGQGTDNDKLLVKGMNIFKQGGSLLPSRNIVERFKLLKGNKLPTAPKAEDRYKGGRRTITAVHPYDPLKYGFRGTQPIRQVNNGSASISEIIRNTKDGTPADTMYYEIPNHLPFVNVQPRYSFSYGNLSSKYGFNPEFNILKKRFNTAWNLAK